MTNLEPKNKLIAKRKYKLNYYLNQLTKEQYSVEVGKFHEAIGISEASFKRYRAIKQNDSQDIPGDVLLKLATHLSELLCRKITVDDLYNYEIPKEDCSNISPASLGLSK